MALLRYFVGFGTRSVSVVIFSMGAPEFLYLLYRKRIFFLAKMYSFFVWAESKSAILSLHNQNT
jgi:hypothetical protein